jgi:hypothetical protein
MFGNLDMNNNNILFRGTALTANTGGNLLWDGNKVCVEGSTVVGCAATGDISDVVAGTGLSGGATSGSATLNVALNGGSAQTCSGTQKVSAVSTTGIVTCTADADTNSGGTVTSVGSGTGLTGGPVTGSGTLSLNINGGSAQTCAGTQKVSAVSPTGIVTCSADADSGGDITGVTAGSGLTGGGTTGTVPLAVDTSTIQSRVTGTCPSGQAVSAVGSTGSVTCVSVGNSFTQVTITAQANVGQYGGSIATCPAGQVAIGGGVQTSFQNGVWMTESWPVTATSWQGMVHNSGTLGNPVMVTVYAICA